MSPRAKSAESKLLSLALAGLLVWLVFISGRGIWQALTSVNASLAIAVVTAAATVLGATVTVMLGRYYERKREIEAHFRTEKIKIYEDFLRELFKVFGSDKKASEDNSDGKAVDDNLVAFLREWQQKLIIWGGSEVLRTYFNWMIRMKQGNPDAQTIFLMDEFFRALRSDIGQRSNGLPRGAFVNLILRHGDFFLAEARKNPSITLSEFATLEKERFGESET